MQRDGYSLQAQESELTEYAKAHGHDIVATFHDVASGATIAKRPAMAELLELVDAKAIDIVLVHKRDRVSRNLLETLQLAARFGKAGVACIVTDIDADLMPDDPNAKLMAQVFAAFGEFERELIGARTKAGMAKAKADGYHVGRAKTGYKLVRSSSSDGKAKKAKVQVADAAAVTYRGKVRTYIAKQRATGASYRSIAEQLHAKGWKTVTGGDIWNPATVRYIERAG
jgi:DNA invertase Pin-like site-specific DNA recombinase